MKREMLLHELHPSLVHMPLALLPTAAVADLIVVTTGDRAWEKVGRRLWVAGAASAVIAGVTGLAASQEVRMDAPRARDMTVAHGVGNALITLGALGLMAWRLTRPPTVLTTVLGLAACASSLVTATIGGKMVYEQGIGINPMPGDAPQGSVKQPRVLSREAPVALLKDAGRGAAWLVGRARALL
ncbi:DUF2231 domain-containing protein [Corallococcus aberystwythensis]|uniref:DUF2231 domain-containing protein n=1 Tax=Corallococcus aberystwythensis TaxID=2316722 RepID=A0A3A8R118_9BACT|nr:DUF2231 domain-containing protein [Corallococcus aberystwythensis]RKH74726.1 DUF2231 domain-containing protein [Corallococcus aberystwythensis]